MKFNIQNRDEALLKNAFGQLGITWSLRATRKHNLKVSCFYINNTDGSIRWLFPASAKTPNFLRFYYDGSLRSGILKSLYQFVYKLKLQKFIVSGCLDIYVDATAWERCINSAEWALFTGTAGVNRKAVLWHVSGENTVFTKIALSAESCWNLENERRSLLDMQSNPCTGVIVPAISESSAVHLSLQDLQLAILQKQPNMINADTFINWCSYGLSKDSKASCEWMKKAEENLTIVEEANDKRIPKSLIIKLGDFRDHMKSINFNLTACSHGDFTPWNVTLAQNKLYMIDWELSNKNMPAMYDAFHYIYQSSILLDRLSYREIRKKINDCFSTPEWQQFLKDNEVDIASAEQAYLFYTINYYLKVYAQQPNWHTQVNWLMNTWNEALSFWLHEEKVLAARQLLVLDMAFCLYTEPYAVFKFMITGIKQLKENSDIDLCIRPHAAKKLYKYLQSHILVAVANRTLKSFMTQMELHTCAGEMLHIDCIFSFRRKSLWYLDAETILNNTFLNDIGVKQPFPIYDFHYVLLFYSLNKSEIPAHYFLYFEPHKDDIVRFLNINYQLAQTDYYSLIGNKELLHQKINSKLHIDNHNTGLHKWLYALLYIKDSLLSFKTARGFVVTFSGVDGAGKSTIINFSKTFAEKNLRRRVIVLRHRPSVLPILSAMKYGKTNAEARSIQTLPRMGNNSNLLSSFARFTYYYMDYLFGQFYVWIKYTSRGYIVIYDRYYFDFINDGKRSNITLPKKFVKWLYRFLLKPEINFFLFASPDVILTRKKELDATVITQLTNEYTGLFNTLDKRYKHSQYLAIENTDLQATLSTIYSHLKSFYREKNC